MVFDFFKQKVYQLVSSVRHSLEPENTQIHRGRKGAYSWWWQWNQSYSYSHLLQQNLRQPWQLGKQRERWKLENKSDGGAEREMGIQGW